MKNHPPNSGLERRPSARTTSTISHVVPDGIPQPSPKEPVSEKMVCGEDIIPNGGYGWVVVLSAGLINAHTWGINSTYGIFLSHYLTNDVFPNTTPLAYAFIGGLSVSMGLAAAPLSTRIVHLYGTRVCLLIGVFLQTLSLIGASFSTKKYQIILSQGICFGWGMGFLFVGSVNVVGQWFTTKRGLANSIAAAGSGVGGLIYSLAVQRMIDTLGLPWTFRILGIVSCTLNILCTYLIKDRNQAVGAHYKAFDTSLLKRPEFLLLQGWSIFSMLGYIGFLYSLPNYAISIGLSAKQASIIAALNCLGQALGRPVIGLASDKVGRINISVMATLVCGLFFIAFWIPAKNMGLLSFVAIIGGGLSGTFWATVASVGAEVLGLPDLPAGLSITWVALIVPTTVAEAIALELRRENTSDIYLHAQIFIAIMYIAAATCLSAVRGWHIGILQEKKSAHADGASESESSSGDGGQRGAKLKRGILNMFVKGIV